MWSVACDQPSFTIALEARFPPYSAIRSIQPETMSFSDTSDIYPQSGGIVGLGWAESARGAGEKSGGDIRKK